MAVPAGDPVVFADVLGRLVKDRALGKEMGRRGRAMAEREFSRSRLAEKFVSMITAR